MAQISNRMDAVTNATGRIKTSIEASIFLPMSMMSCKIIYLSFVIRLESN